MQSKTLFITFTDRRLSTVFDCRLSDVFVLASRKHLRTKVTPDLHLEYSRKGGNLGLVGIKTIKSGYFSIKSYVEGIY